MGGAKRRAPQTPPSSGTSTVDVPRSSPLSKLTGAKRSSIATKDDAKINTKSDAKSVKTSKRTSRKKPAKQKPPATPEQRRRRIPVALAAVFAVAVLATSFPLSSLLSQRHQLAATAAQLAQVRQENRALAQQEHALDSNQAIKQLARGTYQLVSPGQTLYDVLPPSHATGTTTPGAAASGDPGSQPLVAPSNAPDLTPQAALPTPIPDAAGSTTAAAVRFGSSAASTADTVPRAPSTFWGRVVDTLEFWK